MTFDYDKMYDDFVVQSKLLDKKTYYPGFPRDLKDFATQYLHKGWLGYFHPKERDPNHSKIAQDEGYQAFLKKIGHNGCDWLTQSWCTGGQTGGSCWDEGPHSHHGIDAGERPEPVFDPVLTLLELDLRKSEYLALKELVRRDSYCVDEYYGNYTNYDSEGIRLYDLYLKLKEMGYL